MIAHLPFSFVPSILLFYQRPYIDYYYCTALSGRMAEQGKRLIVV